VVPLHDTKQFALFGLLCERLLSYRCTVDDPLKATAFFIPHAYKFTGRTKRNESQLAEQENARAVLYAQPAKTTPHGEQLLTRYGGRT
jgi:hypothetical protein